MSPELDDVERLYETVMENKLSKIRYENKYDIERIS